MVIGSAVGVQQRSGRVATHAHGTALVGRRALVEWARQDDRESDVGNVLATFVKPLRDGGENRSPGAANLRGFVFSNRDAPVFMKRPGWPCKWLLSGHTRRSTRRITRANRGGLISPRRCHVVRYPRLQRARLCDPRFEAFLIGQGIACCRQIFQSDTRCRQHHARAPATPHRESGSHRHHPIFDDDFQRWLSHVWSPLL